MEHAMRIVITYLLALTLFLAMDLVWLGYVAKDFYLSRMGTIMLDRPKMGIAVLFYTVYVIGLMIFVITPALADGNWQTAALNGAMFGFFTYLTYDATAYAVLKGYDPVIAVIDTAWGSLIGAVVSAGTVALMHQFWPDG
jgi:uncharacterized membrane protein